MIIRSLFLLICFTCGTSRLLLAETIPVLLDGDISVEDVPKKKTNWFGLYEHNGSYSLLPVKLTIEPYFNSIADAEEAQNIKSQWSGRTLKATLLNAKIENSEQLILVQSASLKEGSIVTAFPGNDSSENRTVGDFSPLQSISMSVGETHYRLEANSVPDNCEIKLHLDTADTKNKIEDQAITGKSAENNMHDWTKIPYLVAWCGAESPRLVWAGDMDRDGKVDLLLETPHDSTTSTGLFLSSLAEPGKLVKLVGLFTRPSGC